MLARQGHDTHFLLRSDYETVKSLGVQIQSPNGDFRVHPHAAARPEEIGPCDLVLIALKTTANSEFPKLLPPLVGPHTLIVTLQNGLGNEEQLARIFPATQVLGGLCFVCLNRIAPGIIHHIEHGLIVLGEFSGRPQPRTHALAEELRKAGVPCRVSEDLARAHWEKLTWNIPFNGLGVASVMGFEAVVTGRPEAAIVPRGPCLATDALLRDPKWLTLVRELIDEVGATADALGYPLPADIAAQQIERTQTMGPYKASTLLDFEQGRPLELESLFAEPLRQANKAGVNTPRLEALVRVLRDLAQ
jgi:2-dehydropantoate 2-reductase